MWCGTSPGLDIGSVNNISGESNGIWRESVVNSIVMLIS